MAFNLIVAEGHWQNYTNHSVKGLFDLLSDLIKSNNHSYKHLQFADSNSFSSTLGQLGIKEHKYLYIGSHGNEKGIYGSSKANPLTSTIIKNALKDNIKGLYLGTCLFGRPEILQKFLSDKDSLVWCAGYKNSVDWIDSSALDLAFWKIFQIYNTQPGKKVELSMIESSIKELRYKYSSLILDLGFNIAIRRKDKIELAF